MAEEYSKLWYLKQMNLFSAMPPEMAEQMSKMVTDTTVSKGSFIYLNAEPSANIYFLKVGRVKVSSMAEDGREIIKAIIYPGEMFGELAIAGKTTHDDFAVALDDTLICSISAAEMNNMIMMMPKLGLALNVSIGKKMLKLERRLESLIFKDARTRIVELILSMAKDYGVTKDGQTLIKHNLTHQDLANLTATSRQTVTTLLNELKEQGIISMERKKIFVKKIAALESTLMLTAMN